MSILISRIWMKRERSNYRKKKRPEKHPTVFWIQKNRRVSVPMNLSIPVLWLPTQANRICRVKNLFLKRKSVYPMNQLNRPARMTHRSLSLKHPFRKRTMKRIICLMCRELRKKNFLSWIKRNLRMLIFHKLNHPSKQMMHPNQKPTKSLSVRRLRRRKSFRK